MVKLEMMKNTKTKLLKIYLAEFSKVFINMSKGLKNVKYNTSRMYMAPKVML